MQPSVTVELNKRIPYDLGYWVDGTWMVGSACELRYKSIERRSELECRSDRPRRRGSCVDLLIGVLGSLQRKHLDNRISQLVFRQSAR